MPNYTLHGKIETPLADEEFFRVLEEKKTSLGVKKTAFISFLFYTGVRVSEALKLRKEAFSVHKEKLFVDIGERLKHSKRTPPLSVKLNRPFVCAIVKSVERTHAKCRIWKWSRITAWRIMTDTFDLYPHFFRLNRVTDLFQKGFTINEVRDWTGLSLNTLNFYVGQSNTRRIGENI